MFLKIKVIMKNFRLELSLFLPPLKVFDSYIFKMPHLKFLFSKKFMFRMLNLLTVY